MLTQWFQETLTLGISARAIASAVRRFNARIDRRSRIIIKITRRKARRGGDSENEKEYKMLEAEKAKQTSGVSKVEMEEILCC